MNIALVAETAPAKTLIPIIEKLDDVEILSLTHSKGANELLSPYSDEIISIGESRRNTSKKRSNLKIGSLVLKDTYRTYKALKGREVDLLLTCGNAGDVRKGIAAAKKLNIPNIHIEQDIYNPIEMMAYADIITVPDRIAQKKLKMYGITNTINIKGYPQAEYASKVPLMDSQIIYDHYETNDFYVVLLGGDIRSNEVPKLIKEVEKLNKTILIVPYRFSAEFVSKFVSRKRVYVIDGYVDLLSLMNASCGIIYAAGMGVTIEAGVLSTPAVKIEGFHKDHASNDLAHSIGIDVVPVDQIGAAVRCMEAPHGKLLVKKGIKASLRIVDLIRDMSMFDQTQGGYNSFKKIWDQRKKYR